MFEFQNRLEELIEKNNEDQEALAKELGLSYSAFLGYVEKGYNPELAIACKLAKHFNCSVHYLMGLTDDPKVKSKNQLTFMQTLKKLMKENGWSIERLMDHLGMSDSTYYRLKNNDSIPSMKSLTTLSTFFNVTIDYLIGSDKETVTRRK